MLLVNEGFRASFELELVYKSRTPTFYRLGPTLSYRLAIESSRYLIFFLLGDVDGEVGAFSFALLLSRKQTSRRQHPSLPQLPAELK